MTYGNFRIKNSWKDFVADLKYDLGFLHCDEFLKKYNIEDVQFHIAFVKKNKELFLFMSDAEINKYKTLQELIDLAETC